MLRSSREQLVKRKQVEQGFRFEFIREIGQDRMGNGYIKERFSVSVSDLTIQSTVRQSLGGEHRVGGRTL